jgi:hypothetical protein
VGYLHKKIASKSKGHSSSHGVVETIYKEISQLSDGEKIILLNKIMLDISATIQRAQKFNIYDLKGVGKEVWEGIDAQEYVNRERASWKLRK